MTRDLESCDTSGATYRLKTSIFLVFLQLESSKIQIYDTRFDAYVDHCLLASPPLWPDCNTTTQLGQRAPVASAAVNPLTDSDKYGPEAIGLF